MVTGMVCIALGIVVTALGSAWTDDLSFLLICCGVLLAAIGIKELVDIDRYEES